MPLSEQEQRLLDEMESHLMRNDADVVSAPTDGRTLSYRNIVYGTILVLIFNGITIGAVFGHLQQIGSGDPLWRFVAGHAPFELTAIVLAGGAGLRLGFNLIAPGRRTRIDALVAGGIKGAKLCIGIAFMLLVAAFIEAFWSSTQSIPASIKFTVSGVLWTLVFAWLWRGGRGETSLARHSGSSGQGWQEESPDAP